MSLPRPMIELRSLISKMPGFSERGAERFLEWWWKHDREKEELLKSWEEFARYQPCQKCFYFALDNLCDYCKDNQRETSKICVVNSDFAAALLDKETGYKGLYFILGGDVTGTRNIKALESVKKRILFLKERLTKEKISEVIVSTDFTSSGEASALYIEDFLKDVPVEVTRLARGLHIGDSLGYSDPVTLRKAFENREKIIK